MIRVEKLTKHYVLGKKTFPAVDGICFSIAKGEVLGLVGESGCGKSTLAKMLLGLAQPSGGKIFFQEKEILAKREKALFRKVQMIFQDPSSSLNPRMKVQKILEEPTQIHSLPPRVEELLKLVGLDPKDKDKYPHEFSGGQKQRIGIARALALNPEVLICDEPTSSLDLSIQAQILNLLVDLKNKFGLSLLFISHDLAAVRYISDRIAVMRQGRIVELEETENLYKNPNHPYTKLLLSSVMEIFPFQEDPVLVNK